MSRMVVPSIVNVTPLPESIRAGRKPGAAAEVSISLGYILTGPYAMCARARHTRTFFEISADYHRDVRLWT